MTQREILFEGMTEQELLGLPAEEIDSIVLFGEPIVFRAGSASILGSFKLVENRLIIELAQIDGGGEGVLISLGSLAKRFAALRGLTEIEWIIHAVSCAKPNLKLRRVLERRGFNVEEIAGVGPAYHLLDNSTLGLPKPAS
jgi:hypothetical protein